MTQITLLTGPERRRRWRDEDRATILAEAFAPGACVKAVARRHEISTALIYTWRKARVKMHEPPFVEAVVTPDPVAHTTLPVIVIELPRGGRISLAASASPALAAAVLKALR